MTTVYVTYPGGPATRFDRDYYVARHLPMVMAAWGPLGLRSADAFFPAGDGGGTIAVCVCRFRDDATVAAALASPGTPAVMADVQNFTDAEPVQSRGLPL